jgi:hypothetical protein
MTKKKIDIIGVADFETVKKNDKQTKIFLWCLVLEKGEKEHGYSVKSFFDYLNDLPKKNRYTIFFHNLNFDGEFILSYLIRNFINNKCWNFLKSLSGIFYIKYKNIIFKDSFKFLPLSVLELSKNCNLERYARKLKYDYEEVKPWNYRAKKQDILLCYDDCETVLEYLTKLEVKNYPRTKSTAGLSHTKFKKQFTDKEYNHCFKPFDEWESFRPWYTGGFNECWNEWKVENEEIYQIDINSLYPYKMKNEKLPYGNYSPLKSEIYNYGFYTIKIIDSVECVSDKLPFINVNGNYSGFTPRTIYKSNLKDKQGNINGELYLIEPIYNLFKKYYVGNWRLKRDKCYFFKSKQIFTEYISELEQKKIEYEKSGDIANRTITKLLMNSLYGKFGQVKDHERYELQPKQAKKRYSYNKKFYYTENKKTRTKKYYVLETIKETSILNKYVPIAAAITAESRAYLIEHILKIPNQVLYNDTDSLIIKGKPPTDWIDKNIFGKWKIEGKYNNYAIRAAKSYMLFNSETGETKRRLKGISKKFQKNISWEEFKENKKMVVDSLAMKQAEGGAIITKIKKIMLTAEENPKKRGVENNRWVEA